MIQSDKIKIKQKFKQLLKLNIHAHNYIRPIIKHYKHNL